VSAHVHHCMPIAVCDDSAFYRCSPEYAIVHRIGYSLATVPDPFPQTSHRGLRNAPACTPATSRPPAPLDVSAAVARVAALPEADRGLALDVLAAALQTLPLADRAALPRNCLRAVLRVDDRGKRPLDGRLGST
jgi:hypothetical protein